MQRRRKSQDEMNRDHAFVEGLIVGIIVTMAAYTVLFLTKAIS